MSQHLHTTDRVALVLLVGAVLIVTGCRRESRPEPPPEAPLRTIDAPGLARLVERRRGQVVLVDFWATWCGPCVELFPHTVELHRRFRNRGLAVITVSLDDSDNEPAVRKFLAGAEATTENFLSTYGVGPAAFSAFGIDGGALPHVRLYDRQGKLHRTFTGGKSIDPEEMERAAEEIIRGEGRNKGDRFGLPPSGPTNRPCVARCPSVPGASHKPNLSPFFHRPSLVQSTCGGYHGGFACFGGG